MKFCPTCQTQYPEDANFCPQETCATAAGPQRLQVVVAQAPARFQPIERIGGGRTGDVWRARDTHSGADVAYKVVAADAIATPAVLARAEREFKQLMRVASPKIATIVECEKTPAGGLGVAMELCAGDSLERILAAGPVSFEQAKSILGQVGQALLEAQKVGLVHRDIAPKNILVSATGEVKVINFPLAKPINDRVAGVPAYLSPEQIQGKPVDQRSNTYSLGAILYHMLAGEPPFQGPSVQAVLDMHVSNPVLPPSQRRPDLRLPADADKLLLKALDKSSSRRHLTLRLFLNDLDALKEQPAGTGRPAGEAALAKTMMFGGNQADIARMVAEARAAKAAAAAPTPAAVPPSVAAIPGAPAVPATVVPVAPPPAARAMPQPVPMQMQPTIAAGVVPPNVQPSVQPLAVARPAAPVPAPAPAPAPPAKRQPTALAGGGAPAPQAGQPAQPAAPAVIKPHEAGKAPPPKAGAAFRETLWFKQGDVEQLVADAKAKAAASGKGTGDVPVMPQDARPLEDRYADDGSVTVEDRKKFSLRTGGTATALPTAGGEIPGERMNEDEMVGEISSSRRTFILIIAAVVILALVVVIALMLKGKGKDSTAGPTSDLTTEKQARAKEPAAPVPPAASPVAPAVALDAGTPAAPPGKPAGTGLGAPGGAANPAVGGTTGEAKPAAAKRGGKRKHAGKHKR
jgi:serine/threonine-protein kinase